MNALAENQTLNFAYGLTVVYGDNGKIGTYAKLVDSRKKPLSEIGEGQEPIVMPQAVYLKKMAGFGMPPAKSIRLLNFEQLYIKNQSAIRSNRSTCPTRSVSQI